jgi:hypothetical protein
MTRRSQTRENCGWNSALYSKRETEAAWLRLVLSSTATSRPPEGLKRHRRQRQHRLSMTEITVQMDFGGKNGKHGRSRGVR